MLSATLHRASCIPYDIERLFCFRANKWIESISSAKFFVSQRDTDSRVISTLQAWKPLQKRDSSDG